MSFEKNIDKRYGKTPCWNENFLLVTYFVHKLSSDTTKNLFEKKISENVYIIRWKRPSSDSAPISQQ